MHATLSINDSGTAATIEDHSVNGTFVNGERLAKHVAQTLQDGAQKASFDGSGGQYGSSSYDAGQNYNGGASGELPEKKDSGSSGFLKNFFG